MRETETNDAPGLALATLGWVLADERRAERLLALTGLTPDLLRQRLAEPALQAAIIGFVESHEPDLIAAAGAVGVAPAALVAARRRLEA